MLGILLSINLYINVSKPTKIIIYKFDLSRYLHVQFKAESKSKCVKTAFVYMGYHSAVASLYKGKRVEC